MSDQQPDFDTDRKPLIHSSELKDTITIQEVKMLHDLMKEHLNKQIELNKFKDETIDRLQKIVYDYEKGFIFKIKEPFIRDLILLKDSFKQIISNNQHQDAGLSKELDFFDKEIDDLFYSYGVSPIEIDSDVYDREFQIVRSKVNCESPDLDRRIKKTIKQGYLYEDKLVLRKEEVEIWVYPASNEA